MSAQARLYMALDGAKYPQMKAQAIKDLANYPTFFAALGNVANHKHIRWFLQCSGQSETLRLFRIHSPLKAPEFCTLVNNLISADVYK